MKNLGMVGPLASYQKAGSEMIRHKVAEFSDEELVRYIGGLLEASLVAKKADIADFLSLDEVNFDGQAKKAEKAFEDLILGSCGDEMVNALSAIMLLADRQGVDLHAYFVSRRFWMTHKQVEK